MRMFAYELETFYPCSEEDLYSIFRILVGKARTKSQPIRLSGGGVIKYGLTKLTPKMNLGLQNFLHTLI